MSLRAIRASVAAGLLTAAAAGVAAPAALACSCVPPSPATVDRADVVFTGTVTTRADPNAGELAYGSADPITYAIAVDGELKGDVDATARVVTARDSASCGVELEVGERYLVVADRAEGGDGTLTTGLCQGTQALPAGEPLPEFAQDLAVFSPASETAGWPAPTRVSRPAEGTDQPQVAIDPGGGATVVWPRTTYVPGGGERIGTSRLFASSSTTGGRFGTPEVISGEGELAFGGAIAAAGTTHVAVWQGFQLGSSSAAITARARTSGGAWSSPQVLESDGGSLGPSWPRVAGNDAGQAVALWATADRGLRGAAFIAGDWEVPVTVAADVPQQPVGLALGPDGTAIASWWGREAAGVVVRVSVRLPGGAWGQPLTLSRALDLGDAALPHEPPHVSAGAGEALVVWTRPERSFRGSVHAARVGPDGVRGTWRLAAGRGAGDAEGGLDAVGRATVLWSEAHGHDFRIRWAGQGPGGRWSAPRRVAPAGSACETRVSPSLRVSPDGLAHAIWIGLHRRGPVVVAAARPAGGGWSRPRAISRAGTSFPALAASGGGAVVAWSRARFGARARPFVEATVRGVAGAERRSLRELVAPRLTGLRMPSEIPLRSRFPIRLDLPRSARIEVRFERVRPGVRFVGPVRRGGRAGENRFMIPSWSTPGRRLGPGVYRVRVQALTAERASCAVTRRLVVRG